MRRASDVELRVLTTSLPNAADLIGKTLSEIAAAAGKDDLVDLFFDLVISDMKTEFTVDVMNTDEDAVAEILKHPGMLLGLSDAGAHATLTCEAGQTSRFLGYWVRERKLMSLEEGVRRITSMPADLCGFRDRGRLAPGLAADIVVFNPDTIINQKPEMVSDLPGGSKRLVQRARGIAWSFVNGLPVIRDGVFSPTGRAPGRVLRPSRNA